MKPDRRLDIEEIIRTGLIRIGINLIGLGYPGEAIGAGRILATENNWKKEFEFLAEKAAGILVIPSQSPGTLWELERIVANNYLEKAVFIQLTTYSETQWNEVRNACATFGLFLPEFQSEGEAFKILHDGETLSLPLPQVLGTPAVISHLKLATGPRGRNSQGTTDPESIS